MLFNPFRGNYMTPEQTKLLKTEMFAVAACLCSMEGLEDLIEETKYCRTHEEQKLNELARLQLRFQLKACELEDKQEQRTRVLS